MHTQRKNYAQSEGKTVLDNSYTPFLDQVENFKNLPKTYRLFYSKLFTINFTLVILIILKSRPSHALYYVSQMFAMCSATV